MFNYVPTFLPLVLFLVSVFGIILFPGHYLGYFICIEVLLLSAGLNFSFLSLVLDDRFGFAATLVSLAAAAAESAVGLAILVVYNRFYSDILVLNSVYFKA